MKAWPRAFSLGPAFKLILHHVAENLYALYNDFLPARHKCVCKMDAGSVIKKMAAIAVAIIFYLGIDKIHMNPISGIDGSGSLPARDLCWRSTEVASIT